MQSRMSLERYKIFPYIAWALVIGFALFVYSIVQDLRAASSELQTAATRLEIKANTDPEGITDFNH